MTDIEYDIAMTAACDKLRIMVRNEQQVRDYKEAWHAMGQTSTQKRRMRDELNHRNPYIPYKA